LTAPVSSHASSLSEVALLQQMLHSDAQVEPLYQRALAIREQQLGTEHPDVARLLNDLASFYQDQGKDTLAEPCWQRALSIREQQLGPNHIDVAYSLEGLARLYEKQGRLAQAEPFYQRVLHIWEQRLASDPNDARAYLKRGYAYLFIRQCEHAYADFIKLTSLQPEDVNAAWMAVYTGLSKERPGIETAERLEMIATLDPQCYEAYTSRGVALGLRGKPEEGLTELEQALHLQPRSEDALFWKGMMCAYLGRNTLAIESIKQAQKYGLPPILLTPLFWLEQNSPNFYQEYAEPLLKRYEVT